MGPVAGGTAVGTGVSRAGRVVSGRDSSGHVGVGGSHTTVDHVRLHPRPRRRIAVQTVEGQAGLIDAVETPGRADLLSSEANRPIRPHADDIGVGLHRSHFAGSGLDHDERRPEVVAVTDLSPSCRCEPFHIGHSEIAHDDELARHRTGVRTGRTPGCAAGQQQRAGQDHSC